LSQNSFQQSHLLSGAHYPYQLFVRMPGILRGTLRRRTCEVANRRRHPMYLRWAAMYLAGILLRGAGTLCGPRLPFLTTATVASAGSEGKHRIVENADAEAHAGRELFARVHPAASGRLLSARA